MTLPQPCWSRTGATEWIMSQCHQTESPGCDVGDRRDRRQQDGVPLLAGREGPVRLDPAHVVLGHVVQQRAQHQVGHRLGDRHGVQHALVVGHLAERGPALEGAEGRAHRRAGVLRRLGPVGGVPRVVRGEVAGEQVPEVLLVALGHPQVERAGVEVGAQTAGVGARRAAPDAVGVEGVEVGVEPAVAVRVGGPLPVEEGLHRGHPRVLPGLHLGARPVDRVDLRLATSPRPGAEEVVGRSGVVLEEVVGLDVVDDVAVPLLGLGAVEVTADHRAAAALQQREGLGADRAGLDVGVVDDRPDLLAARLGRPRCRRSRPRG